MNPSAFCAACAFLPVVAYAADATSLPVHMDFDLSNTPTLACDVAANGHVFALGATWKMTFTEDGATFIAILGESAPRNMGLHFAFPGLAKPHLEGGRVTIDRGAFTEVYDFAPSQVEQSFVISQRAHDGDLVMRIPLATELVADGRDSNGLCFVAPDLGAISYGDATTIDALGRRVGSEPRVIDGAIEIVVPDAFLDVATFPIVIDPILQAFPIDESSTVASDPDIAYAKQTDQWFVAYERTISATDHDVVVRRLALDGTFIADFAVAVNTSDHFDPAIAERFGVLLTVWDHGLVPGVIQARRITASNSQMGTTFDVSLPTAHDLKFPDIGSTDAAVSAPFCVTWTSTQNQIRARTVSDAAAIGNEFQSISGVPFDEPPSILPFAPAGTEWLITGARLGGNGLDAIVSVVTTAGVQTASITIATQVLTAVSRPVIAGTSRNAMLAWISDNGSSLDLIAKAIEADSLFPHQIAQGFIELVGAIDHGGSESVNQTEVALGYDGARFLVAYAEEKSPGAATDIVASVWGKSGLDLMQLQPLVSLSSHFVPELDIGIAGAGLDRPGEVLVAWTENITTPPKNDSIDGILFSTLGIGNTTTVQTGCGSPEPIFITSTPVVAGGTINVSIIGAASPLMFGGFPTSLALCPGQAGCTLGVTPLVVTAVPPAFSFTWPADATLIGVPVALQVVDLLPANATGAICGPPKYAQKFRVSDTRVITTQ